MTAVVCARTESQKTKQQRTVPVRAGARARTAWNQRLDQTAANVLKTPVRAASLASRRRGRDASVSVRSLAATHLPVLPGDVARRATSRTAGLVRAVQVTASVQRRPVVLPFADAAADGKVCQYGFAIFSLIYIFFKCVSQSSNICYAHPAVYQE